MNLSINPYSYNINFGTGKCYTKEKLTDLFINKGYAVKQAAQELGTSTSTINRWNKIFGIKPFKQTKKQKIFFYMERGLSDKEIARLTQTNIQTVRNVRAYNKRKAKPD